MLYDLCFGVQILKSAIFRDRIGSTVQETFDVYLTLK